MNNMDMAEKQMRDADYAREHYQGRGPIKSNEPSAEGTGPMMTTMPLKVTAPARNRDKNFFGHYEVTRSNVVKNAPLALNQTKKDKFVEPMANVRKVQGAKRAY